MSSLVRAHDTQALVGKQERQRSSRNGLRDRWGVSQEQSKGEMGEI